MADVNVDTIDTASLRLLEGAWDTTISGDVGMPVGLSELVTIFGQAAVADTPEIRLAEATPQVAAVLVALDSCGVRLTEVAALGVFVRQMDALGVDLVEQLHSLEIRLAVAEVCAIGLEEARMVLALLVAADQAGIAVDEVVALAVAAALVSEDTAAVGLSERAADLLATLPGADAAALALLELAAVLTAIPPGKGRVVVATVQPVHQVWGVTALMPARTLVAA